MSAEQDEKRDPESAAPDPFGQVIEFYDAISKTWSRAMSDAVGSESFARSMGEQMEGSLEAMSLMHKQMGDLMEKYLERTNLPTRKDVTALSERLARLEMAVDDLGAKLDQILDHLQAGAKENQ